MKSLRAPGSASILIKSVFATEGITSTWRVYYSLIYLNEAFISGKREHILRTAMTNACDFTFVIWKRGYRTLKETQQNLYLTKCSLG